MLATIASDCRMARCSGLLMARAVQPEQMKRARKKAPET